MGYLKYFLPVALLGGLTVGHKDATNLSNSPSGCSSSSYFNARSIATDSRGRLHVIYADCYSGSKGLKRSYAGKHGRFALHRKARGMGALVSPGKNPYDVPVDDVTWRLEYYEGPQQLYYKRSLDGGSTWDDTVRLVDSVDIYPVATMATNGLDAVHVLYRRLPPEGDGQGIYHKRSLDGGGTWGSDVLLQGDPRLADPTLDAVSIATADANVVHAIWRKGLGSAAYRFIYARSANSGSAWEPLRELVDAVTTNSVIGYVLPAPSIAASKNLTHLVWQDTRDDSACNIYYKRSADYGETWDPDVRLTTDTLLSIFPTVTATGNMVYVGWLQLESIGSGFNYCLRRSGDGGVSWESTTPLMSGISVKISDAYESNAYRIPQIAGREELLTVVWDNLISPETGLWFMYSVDQGTNWSDTICVRVQAVERRMLPSVAIDDSRGMHIVWTDAAQDQYDVYYTRYGAVQIEEKRNSRLRTADSGLRIHPNPISHFTTISYAIPETGHVTLRVYDVAGRVVRTLVNERKEPGDYEVRLSVEGIRLGGGKALAAGVYFVRLDLQDSVQPVTAQATVTGHVSSLLLIR